MKVKLYIIFFVTYFYYVYEDIILYNLGRLKSENKGIFDNVMELLYFPTFNDFIEIVILGFLLSGLSTFTIYLIEKYL